MWFFVILKSCIQLAFIEGSEIKSPPSCFRSCPNAWEEVDNACFLWPDVKKSWANAEKYWRKQPSCFGLKTRKLMTTSAPEWEQRIVRHSSGSAELTKIKRDIGHGEMEAPGTSHNGRHSLSSNQITMEGMRTAFKSTMKIQKRDGMIIFVRRRSSLFAAKEFVKMNPNTKTATLCWQ